MLGSPDGRDYDLVDSATGEAVLRVRHLGWEEPATCCICDKPTYSRFCVPYYCGAVRVGHPEAGGAVACEPCYQRWEKWNDTPRAALKAAQPDQGGAHGIGSSTDGGGK